MSYEVEKTKFETLSVEELSKLGENELIKEGLRYVGQYMNVVGVKLGDAMRLAGKDKLEYMAAYTSIASNLFGVSLMTAFDLYSMKHKIQLLDETLKQTRAGTLEMFKESENNE